MNTDTLTETYTVTVTTEDCGDGAGIHTVRALVQDGRSCGAYYVTHTFGAAVPVADAVNGFLRELAKYGQELHPEL